MRKALVVLGVIVSLAGCAGGVIVRRGRHRTRSVKSAKGALEALVRYLGKGVVEAHCLAHKKILRTHQGQRARHFNRGADRFGVRSKQLLDAVVGLLKNQQSSKKAAIFKWCK